MYFPIIKTTFRPPGLERNRRQNTEVEGRPIQASKSDVDADQLVDSLVAHTVSHSMCERGNHPSLSLKVKKRSDSGRHRFRKGFDPFRRVCQSLA